MKLTRSLSHHKGITRAPARREIGDFENGIFWQIFKDGDKPDRIFQNGGGFGTSRWLTIIPQSRSGVFIVTNVAGPNVHQKLKESADRILDVPSGTITTRFGPTRPTPRA